MPDRGRIVAVGLLTQHDLARLGDTFNRAYPVEKLGDFDDLLRAIDEAEARLEERDGNSASPAHGGGSPQG